MFMFSSFHPVEQYIFLSGIKRNPPLIFTFVIKENKTNKPEITSTKEYRTINWKGMNAHQLSVEMEHPCLFRGIHWTSVNKNTLIAKLSLKHSYFFAELVLSVGYENVPFCTDSGICMQLIRDNILLLYSDQKVLLEQYIKDHSLSVTTQTNFQCVKKKVTTDEKRLKDINKRLEHLHGKKITCLTVTKETHAPVPPYTELCIEIDGQYIKLSGKHLHVPLYLFSMKGEHIGKWYLDEETFLNIMTKENVGYEIYGVDNLKFVASLWA